MKRGNFDAFVDDMCVIAPAWAKSNGWDAAAAASYGFGVLWVNRAGDPMDRLPGTPQYQADDLSGLAALVATL